MIRDWQGLRLYTIGHSTLEVAELYERLRSFEVRSLADVRTIPKSHHNPQFNSATLGRSLSAQDIEYHHLASLGGLRHARKDSTNMAWRNASFRGFADYMQTPQFEDGLAELWELVKARQTVIMCAESVPWRCHRSLIADALVTRGAIVEHIMGISRANPHRLTPFAFVRGSQVTYPGDAPNADAYTLPLLGPALLPPDLA